jgi:4-alpha-glucanotransferase
MPVARLPTLSDRASGVLLHPTSLPAGDGDGGDLGREAFRFVDFLAGAGQGWWQMLPVGPTGYGNSPYSALSAFAGSPALVSTDRLQDDGLLSAADRQQPRARRLLAAFAAFRHGGGHPDHDAFAAGARGWLEDFALYDAIKRAHGDVQWTRWPAGVRDRDPGALAEARVELAEGIAFARFVQWRFDRDWRALRRYAHERGVGLIGDIPIFMAHDSADVWRDREHYTLGRAGEATHVAGVPPDYFSSTGQRWGNPLYRWARMRKTGYAWWIERFRATLAAFDAVRLDHFIGFCRYWMIPGSEPTAVRGRWRPGPGAALFSAVRAALGGELPLIAEDLGVVTPEVRALRDAFGLPGIKIFQFAFGTDPNADDFLPHNYPRNAVVYTGTHDNDTIAGWFHDRGSGTRSAEQTEIERRAALRYLGHEHASHADARDIHWQMIRAVLASVANVAIVPAQDLLGLGSQARTNTPGTAEGNWAFQLAPGALSDAIADRLRGLCEIYGRVRAQS